MIPKFRVYIKNLKMMLPVENIDFTHESVAVNVCEDDYIHCDPYEYDFDDENIVVMQSTGLKDKNGAEIFEGDIFIDNTWHKYRVIWDESRFIGVDNIRTESGFICYVDACYKDGTSRLEVIGNTYENSELMEENDDR